MENYKKLWLEILLLIGSFTWVFFSYEIPLFGDPKLWFSRSGALMVLAAAIIEYRLGNVLNNKISNATAAAGLGIPCSVRISKQNHLIDLCAHLFIVLGTIVWAYGDLIK